MKIFKDGTINGIPYWGYFETRDLADKVISDLTNALSIQPENNQTDSREQGKYVLTFKMNDQLYINRRGYNAFLVVRDNVWYPPHGLKTYPFPSDGVLVLSKNWIDDLPKYTTASEFCRIMKISYFHQYCIPLRRDQAEMATGNVFQQIKYADYHKVSPFELKNTLIAKAQEKSSHFLNVGRGNPNFVNTVARDAYSHLLRFTDAQATRFAEQCNQGDCTDNPAIGFVQSNPKGLAKRLAGFTSKLTTRGGLFLKEAVEWMQSHAVGQGDELTHQLMVAGLGSFYPDPPAAQPFVKKVMNRYMDYILLHKRRPDKEFDIFMTEGATAGIMYTFKSLRINGLLNAGDHIAIITPIFTPYLELPELAKYNLREIYITGDPNQGWKIPIEELEKLKDPQIKALFLVNPTNPTAVSMTEAHVQRVAEIVKNHNPTLLIIADSVYAPFVDSYHSFMSHLPSNTIEMYSFSKYFGVTGWRMGMIVMHPDNVIDQVLLPTLPAAVKRNLEQRYSIVTETGQSQLTFMQRLVLDSRDVAEAHTGGLATPQQTLMCLFAIYDMTHRDYKPAIKEILVKRIKKLYAALGMAPPIGPGDTDYYTLVDIKALAAERHGLEFIPKLMQRDPLEVVFRLAIDYATVCLPAAGFHGPEWAIRVSLANAPTDDYTQVGKNVVSVVDDMYLLFRKK